MKNGIKDIFLGGTCAESEWREQLIPKIEKLTCFDPVVDDWNEEAQKEEKRQRKDCRFCLYVITPQMEGVYSIAEVVDDSNKRPKATVFCVLKKHQNKEFTKGQMKSLDQVKEMIKDNGGRVCDDLDEVADFFNSCKELNEMRKLAGLDS